MSKAKINSEEFDLLIGLIFENITIIPKEEYENYAEQAKILIKDVKDVPFMALCLAYKTDGIWSDDAHFSEQNKIKIFKTPDMLLL